MSVAEVDAAIRAANQLGKTISFQERKEGADTKSALDFSINRLDKKLIGDWRDHKNFRLAYSKPTGKLRLFAEVFLTEGDIAAKVKLGMLTPQCYFAIATDSRETLDRMASALSNKSLFWGSIYDYPDPTPEFPYILRVSIRKLVRRAQLPLLFRVLNEIESIPVAIRDRIWQFECHESFLESMALTIRKLLSARTTLGFKHPTMQVFNEKTRNWEYQPWPDRTVYTSAMEFAESSGTADMYYLIADECAKAAKEAAEAQEKGQKADSVHFASRCIVACNEALKATKRGLAFRDESLQSETLFLLADTMLDYELDEEGNDFKKVELAELATEDDGEDDKLATEDDRKVKREDIDVEFERNAKKRWKETIALYNKEGRELLRKKSALAQLGSASQASASPPQPPFTAQYLSGLSPSPMALCGTGVVQEMRNRPLALRG